MLKFDASLDITARTNDNYTKIQSAADGKPYALTSAFFSGKEP